MDQAREDPAQRRRRDGRDGDSADAWLGWIACHMDDREPLRWWSIPELLPARQVLLARRLIQCAVIAAVAIASFALMFPRFSAWGIVYLVLAFLAARSFAGNLRLERAPARLPPVWPRMVRARWPGWTARAGGMPGGQSYRADRVACAASALAWAPAGALAGAMACGWGSVSAWPAVTALHAAGATVIAGARSGAYPRLKLAELALAAQWGRRVSFARLLEDAVSRGILRRKLDGYAFADEEVRARLKAAGEQALAAHRREQARKLARTGPLPATAAALSGSRGTRISVDLAAGTFAFFGLIVAAEAGPHPWAALAVTLVLVGSVGAVLAFAAAHAALEATAGAARWAAAEAACLSRAGLRVIAGAAAAIAIAAGALLVADAGTFLARALAFALPAALVAACGLWACALALRRWRGRRWLGRIPDVIAIAATGAALLVLADRRLLTTELAAALLFPVAVTASIRGWAAMTGSRRLAVRAAADITLSLLLGAQLVLFLAWLANVAGMPRAEVARLRSALESAGSDVNSLLDWRIWVGGYILLAAASMALAVWPARLRAAGTWPYLADVAAAAGAAQRALTGLSIGLLTVVLLAAAGPATLVPLLRHQLRDAYLVALQRQFAAEGEAAAYAQVTRAFTPPGATFPVLIEIVREVHGKAHGRRDAASAEADLAHRLGQLQAAALSFGLPPSPGAAPEPAAAGFGGPASDLSGLGRQAAQAEGEQGKSDAAASRVELAAELAAAAVANTISIPQVSSSEVVAVITEYLSGLIEDSPLKAVFAAWLERVPRGQQPPDAVTMVVPDPAGLALAAQEQLFAQARADGVIPPLADPLAGGASGAAVVKAAVDLASQASDIRRGGTCAGCTRLPRPGEEPPAREHPFER
jgi:hypothetical protein